MIDHRPAQQAGWTNIVRFAGRPGGNPPCVDMDVVRRFYAAWSRGDLDGMLAEAHPEIEARPTLGVLYEHSAYHAHAGIAGWFGEVAARWDAFDPRVEETRVHDGRVIAFIHLTARRRGEPFDARIAVEHDLRDGRIATLVGRDVWEVREELGLD